MPLEPKQIAVRGWYENMTSNLQPMRNVLAFDHITPWIEAELKGYLKL